MLDRDTCHEHGGRKDRSSGDRKELKISWPIMEGQTPHRVVTTLLLEMYHRVPLALTGEG